MASSSSDMKHDSSISSGSSPRQDSRFDEGKHADDHIVDDYELKRILGKGHFGTVRLAQRISTGNYCALKMIEYNKGSDRQRELFRREVLAMESVKHLNIVALQRTVYNAPFFGTNFLLLELEQCRGGELFDYIMHDGEFPEGVAKHYFRQLMDAMVACHQLGVYHRDLKPENILLSGEPHYTLKLGDFGLAAVVETSGVNTMDMDGIGASSGPQAMLRTRCGTRAYQAPEIINARPGGGNFYEGELVDVWSAGVVLFIMLLGNPPFEIAGRTSGGNFDWWYNACRLNRHADFWLAHQRPPCPQVNSEPKQFINRIFQDNPDRRARFTELTQDVWIHNPQSTWPPENVARYMSDRALAMRRTKEAEKEKARRVARSRGGEAIFTRNVNRSVSDASSSSMEGSMDQYAPPVMDEASLDREFLFAGSKYLYSAAVPDTLFDILLKVCNGGACQVKNSDPHTFSLEVEVGEEENKYAISLQIWRLSAAEDHGVILLEAKRATCNDCSPWDLQQEWKRILEDLVSYDVAGAMEALDAEERVSPKGGIGLRRRLAPPSDIVLPEDDRDLLAQPKADRAGVDNFSGRDLSATAESNSELF